MPTQIIYKMVAHMAGSLVSHVHDFIFLCSVVIWYDMLLYISVISKTLQSEFIDVVVSIAISLLERHSFVCQT